MRIALPLLLLVLLLGGIVAALWLPRTPEPPRGDEAVGAPATAAPTAPAGDAPAADEAVRVWVRVEPRYLLQAAQRRIDVRRHGAPLEVDAEIVAGEGLFARGAPVGPSLVRVMAPGAEAYRRTDTGDDGVLRVELGPPGRITGRVVDDVAQPVVDAEVWCGDATERTVRTDDDGRFEAWVAAGDGVPIVVRARGKAWKARFLDVPPSGADAGVFVLMAEAACTVRAAGPRQTLAQAQAFVVPTAEQSVELLQYPFFAQGWWASQQPGDDGRAAIPGLPVEVEVGLLVVGPLLARGAPAKARLRREHNFVDVLAVERPSLRVQALALDGSPVPAVRVQLLGSGLGQDEALAPLSPSLLPPRGAASGWTGADGRCDLAVGDPRSDFAVVAERGGARAIVRRAAADFGAVELLLPERVAPVARLVVRAPRGAPRWRLRVDQAREGAWAAGGAEPMAVVIDGAQVADLVVRVDHGKGWSEPWRLERALLDGDFELPLAATER